MPSTTPIVRLTRYNPDDPFGPMPAAPRSPPRLWTVCLMLPVAAALVGVSTSIALAALFFPVARQLRAMALGPRQLYAALTAQPAGLFAAALASSLTLAGCALVASTLSPKTPPLAVRLRLRECPRWALLGFFGAVATLGLSSVGNSLRARVGAYGEGPVGVLSQTFTGLSPELTVLGVLIVGAGAAIGEELFFRGYLQTRFEERWAPWLANIVAAALFGLGHGEPWHSASAFGAGLVYGWLARRTGSVLPSITAHALNNAFWVVTMSLGAGAQETWYHDGGVVNLLRGAGLVAIGLGALAWLTRGSEG